MPRVFPYAPEQIVKMVTAYKPCNDAAPAAGIARKGATTQMQSVLNSISPEILQFTEIDGIANATGDKTVTAVSALAKVIRRCSLPALVSKLHFGELRQPCFTVLVLPR